MKQGLSLLEVIIAMAMLVVVVATTMNSLWSFKGWAKNLEDDEYIEDNIIRVKKIVGGDLTNTGWFLLGTNTNGTPQQMYPQVHFYRSSGIGVTSPQPVPVVVGAPVPSPDQDAHVVVPASTVPKIVTSDVLYFVKMRTGTTVDTNPQNVKVDQINFNTKPVPLTDFASAPVSIALIFNSTQSGSQPFVSPAWESSLDGLTWAQNADPVNVRIYRYYVSPDPSTGYRTGILMKSYANAGNADGTTSNNKWNWVDQGEVCRDVKTLTFDTSFTDSSLSSDQVRVRIVFLREGMGMSVIKTDASSVIHSRREKSFEGIFSMRSLP